MEMKNSGYMKKSYWLILFCLFFIVGCYGSKPSPLIPSFKSTPAPKESTIMSSSSDIFDLKKSVNTHFQWAIINNGFTLEETTETESPDKERIKTVRLTNNRIKILFIHSRTNGEMPCFITKATNTLFPYWTSHWKPLYNIRGVSWKEEYWNYTEDKKIALHSKVISSHLNQIYSEIESIDDKEASEETRKEISFPPGFRFPPEEDHLNKLFGF